MATERARETALVLRKNLGIRGMLNLNGAFNAAIHLGISVFPWSPESMRGFRSWLFMIGRGKYDIIINASLPEWEMVWAIAHEIGQVVSRKGSTLPRNEASLATGMAIPQMLAEDAEADQFASLLIYGEGAETHMRTLEYILMCHQEHFVVIPGAVSSQHVLARPSPYPDVACFAPIYVIDRTHLAQQEVIEEFEFLINKKEAKESELQVFFQRHPRMLMGVEAKDIRWQVLLEREDASDLIPDFMLQNSSDGLWDILELKKPMAPVLVGRPGRKRYSRNVHDALAQVREYGEFFEEKANREKVLRTLGLRVYKPHIAVVIGRSRGIPPEEMRAAAHDLREPAVITYDQVLQKFRNLVRDKKEEFRGHP